MLCWPNIQPQFNIGEQCCNVMAQLYCPTEAGKLLRLALKTPDYVLSLHRYRIFHVCITINLRNMKFPRLLLQEENLIEDSPPSPFRHLLRMNQFLIQHIFHLMDWGGNNRPVLEPLSFPAPNYYSTGTIRQHVVALTCIKKEKLAVK